MAKHLRKIGTLDIGTAMQIDDTIYRLIAKDGAAKQPLVALQLKDLVTGVVVEKHLPAEQTVATIAIAERKLEYLYCEQGKYLFLDVQSLDRVWITAQLAGDKVSFFKEGIEVTAFTDEGTLFALELPQFLELMVVKIESNAQEIHLAGSSNKALLETGAMIEVPPFVEEGDILKVDTHVHSYIQRV